MNYLTAQNFRTTYAFPLNCSQTRLKAAQSILIGSCVLSYDQLIRFQWMTLNVAFMTERDYDVGIYVELIDCTADSLVFEGDRSLVRSVTSGCTFKVTGSRYNDDFYVATEDSFFNSNGYVQVKVDKVLTPGDNGVIEVRGLKIVKRDEAKPTCYVGLYAGNFDINLPTGQPVFSVGVEGVGVVSMNPNQPLLAANPDTYSVLLVNNTETHDFDALVSAAARIYI